MKYELYVYLRRMTSHVTRTDPDKPKKDFTIKLKFSTCLQPEIFRKCEFSQFEANNISICNKIFVGECTLLAAKITEITIQVPTNKNIV